MPIRRTHWGKCVLRPLFSFLHILIPFPTHSLGTEIGLKTENCGLGFGLDLEELALGLGLTLLVLAV